MIVHTGYASSLSLAKPKIVKLSAGAYARSVLGRKLIVGPVPMMESAQLERPADSPKPVRPEGVAGKLLTAKKTLPALSRQQILRLSLGAYARSLLYRKLVLWPVLTNDSALVRPDLLPPLLVAKQSLRPITRQIAKTKAPTHPYRAKQKLAKSNFVFLKPDSQIEIDPITGEAMRGSRSALGPYSVLAISNQVEIADGPDVYPPATPLPPTDPGAPWLHNKPVEQLAFATIQGGMESFIAPEPQSSINRADPFAPLQMPRKRFHRVVQTVQKRFDGAITYSAASGLLPVSLSLSGMVDGTDFATGIDPAHLTGANVLSNNSLLISQKGQGIAIGGGTGQVPDAGVGVRMFKPVEGKNGVAGMGLYQRLGTTGLSLIPGFDTEIRTSSSHVTDLAVAADSSLRLSETSRFRGWGTSTFLGWSALNGQAQSSMSMSRHIGSTSVSQDFGVSTGKGSAASWSQSLAQRFGPTDVAAETSLSKGNGTTLNLLSLGLIRPIGRDLFSMDWQSDSSHSAGSSQSQQQLTTNFAIPVKNGSMITLTDSFSPKSSTGQHLMNVSDSWRLGKVVELQLGLNRDWVTGIARLNGSVGIWVTPDWEGRFMIGASTDPITGRTQSALFGFQLVNRFNFTTYASGTICGTALLDDQPITSPIKLTLDDNVFTTDRHGFFTLHHVLVGAHNIGFDMTTLPADIDPDNDGQTVDVGQGKTVTVVLKAARVGEIKGKVDVAEDAFGKVDPTAGSGLVITDGAGHSTTTNPDDTFILSDLPVGKHTITISPNSLPPGYTVVGDASIDVVITDKHDSQDILFSISPNQQVDMQTLPSKTITIQSR